MNGVKSNTSRKIAYCSLSWDTMSVKWLGGYPEQADNDAQLGQKSARALLRPLSAWLVFLAIIVVTAVAWPLTAWLYSIAGDDPARKIDAVRTGLSVAAGTGGVFALLLAFRRQRTTELIAEQNRLASERDHDQRDRVAVQAENDALARRVTDQYSAAAEQLGSDRAPVRLAGLYALERIGETNEDERQAVINLICAYLRMPFGKSDNELVQTASEVQEREGSKRDELEVRRAAQNIIVNRTTTFQSELTGDHWPNLAIDLSRAYLYNFNLVMCSMKELTLENSTLDATTNILSVNVTGSIRLQLCKFMGPTEITELRVDGVAVVTNCRFGSSLTIRRTAIGMGLIMNQNDFAESVYMQALTRGGKDSSVFEWPEGVTAETASKPDWITLASDGANTNEFSVWSRQILRDFD